MKRFFEKQYAITWIKLLRISATFFVCTNSILADELKGVRFEYVKRALYGKQYLSPPVEFQDDMTDMGFIYYAETTPGLFHSSQSNGLQLIPVASYPARLKQLLPFPEKSLIDFEGVTNFLPQGFEEYPSTRWRLFTGGRPGYSVFMTQIRAWAKIDSPAIKRIRIPMIQVDTLCLPNRSEAEEYECTSTAEFVIPEGGTESEPCDIVDRTPFTYADLGEYARWENGWLPLSIITPRGDEQPLLVGESVQFSVYCYMDCPTLTSIFARDIDKVTSKLMFTWKAVGLDGAVITGPSGLGVIGWSGETTRGITSKPDFYKIICKVQLENGQSIEVITYRKVVLASMAVDANRDGEITFDDKDKTVMEKPFRFWINKDDDDFGEGNDTGGTFDRLPAVNFDHQNNTIDFIRDLEDFSRISLYLPDIYWDRIKTGEIPVGLRWSDTTGENPAINIFWQDDQYSGQVPYFASIGSALNQAGTSATAAQKIMTVSGGRTSYFPRSFLDKLPLNSGPIHVLFEGAAKGKGRLDLVFRVDGQDVVCNGPWISLMDVAQFYQRGRTSLTATQISDPWTTPTPPTITSIPDNIPEFVADPNETEQCIIHVHGWRMTKLESINWSETTFKRLWQLGYKGRFATFRWATFSDDTHPPIWGQDVPSKLTYNRSEYRSWLCGPALAQFVNALPYEGSRYLIAHSMGNVISGKALQDGMKVNRYVMCNAAMAAMSYDPSITNFPLNVSLTPDTDSDPATAAFGLKNRFNDNLTTRINYYLPKDEALASWIANQELNKPDWFTFSSYYYDPFGAQGNKIYYGSFPDSILPSRRNVTSLAEAMGHVAKSRSDAVGAVGRTNGSISSKVGMDGFGFDKEHSAEWNWSLTSSYKFWRSLFESFKIPTTAQKQ